LLLLGQIRGDDALVAITGLEGFVAFELVLANFKFGHVEDWGI